ncbi:hypothetical protein [Shewanella kaireitica]|uniref:hypothetical protein n=1 Tax=Shewanella kaireitica TaxID=212021 RepID=UPI00200BA70C|nr:hypothetical protein [Shewanella kaireitica]
MRLFGMVGIILLLIGGFLLSPMSASASVANLNQHKSQSSTQSSNQANAGNFFAATTFVEPSQTSVQDWVINDSLSLTLLDPSEKTTVKERTQAGLQGSHLEHTFPLHSEYAPLVSQRFMSFAQHERLHSRPDYQVAFEFISPLVPSLTVGYRMDSPPAVDWQLHVGGSSFRLSAWKESNLLYRLSHTRSA